MPTLGEPPRKLRALELQGSCHYDEGQVQIDTGDSQAERSGQQESLRARHVESTEHPATPADPVPQTQREASRS